MKTIPSALATHYALASTTVCACLKIVRSDAVVFGITSADHAIVFEGVTYVPGMQVSSLASTEGLNVDNLEATIVPQADETQLRADLRAGRWNNAKFTLFQLNESDLTAGRRDTLKRGTLGQVQFRTTHFVVELRSLTQALQQTQGIATQINCRARLGDDKCTKDLTAFTFSGTVTAVADRANFADSARAEAAGYFKEGELTFSSGDNAGLTRKVKAFAAGVIEVAVPYWSDILVGDGYTIVAGCQKRLAEDCRDKFDNVLNYQGEPHLPGLDALTSPGKPVT